MLVGCYAYANHLLFLGTLWLDYILVWLFLDHSHAPHVDTQGKETFSLPNYVDDLSIRDLPHIAKGKVCPI